MADSRGARPMRIVDVCAFYSPHGGGVRTYVDAKFGAAARFGHEMIVIAPGKREEMIRRGPGAILATIPSPPLPVDRRYRYFHDAKALHRALDRWRPDHVEASSPWSSATIVGRWQGAAPRSLVMHSDPMAAYAYRWLGGLAGRERIDRWCGWFWRHLRGLDGMFDLVISANRQLSDRLRRQGLAKVSTVPMGVEGGIFSPALRSHETRDAVLRRLGLDASATLLAGIGRLSGEKRWEMVIGAVRECARTSPVGLVLVGDGPKRRRLERLAPAGAEIAVLPRITDRLQLATLLASVDGLIHGCEAETFCMVAAEARASGIPLIVPDRGAAADQLVPGAGGSYRSGNRRSLEQAIADFIERGPELQRAAAARASGARTIDDHFAELFRRYAALRPARVLEPVAIDLPKQPLEPAFAFAPVRGR